MFIRLMRRSLMYGAILGLATGVWQSSTAILESIRDGTATEAPSFHVGFGETPSRQLARGSRSSRVADLLQDEGAARVEAFERFRMESDEFWMREYEAELEAAEERIARGTEAAIEIASQVNTSAAREAVRTARSQLGVHYGEAARIAARQAAADAAAVKRIAGRQAAADKTAAERIAVAQAEADRQAAEIIARQQTELNRRIGERVAAEQNEANRLATGRAAPGGLRITTLKLAPSSWDGQHAPVP